MRQKPFLKVKQKNRNCFKLEFGIKKERKKKKTQGHTMEPKQYGGVEGKKTATNYVLVNWSTDDSPFHLQSNLSKYQSCSFSQPPTAREHHTCNLPCSVFWTDFIIQPLESLANDLGHSDENHYPSEASSPCMVITCTVLLVLLFFIIIVFMTFCVFLF